LQIPVKDFAKAFESAGESTLVYINVDGQAYPVIIHDVSRDPVTDDVIHADFYKVRLDEKIKTNVPVEFVGEASAVKDLGGIFVRNVNELEVEALPQDLPHELTIDISVLKLFGDKVTIGDIKKSLGSGVVLTAEDDEAIIATRNRCRKRNSRKNWRLRPKQPKTSKSSRRKKPRKRFPKKEKSRLHLRKRAPRRRPNQSIANKVHPFLLDQLGFIWKSGLLISSLLDIR